MRKYIILLGVSVLYACSLRAQTYTSYTTTENETWKVGKETLKNKRIKKSCNTPKEFTALIFFQQQNQYII